MRYCWQEPAGDDNELTVVSGGLLEKALTVDAVPHGTRYL